MTQNAVELDGLHKAFGRVRAVDGVTLQVPAGQIVAMLGPNGAGKSTTNEMILGLATPDTGSVRVFGEDPVHAVRGGRTGAMLQGGALLDQATALDMLRMMHGLHRHPLPLSEAIGRADCSEFLKTKTDKLSGGQAQRLRYALAILPDPELLILDEPTVSMDVETRRSFWISMRSFISTGRTVIFATHYLEEADEVADRVVLLARGRVVADGTGAEIKGSVGGRIVSFSHPRPKIDVWKALPGVTAVETAGARVQLQTTDSDGCLRELLARDPEAHDFEVSTPKLEDAFRELTTTHENQELAA